MNSSPRAVPFLPDGHRYWQGYHFPAMARCDPQWHKAGWLNHQRSAQTRQKHREKEREAGQ